MSRNPEGPGGGRGTSEVVEVFTPRRKVAVRVRTVRGEVIDGELYAELRQPDGRPGRIGKRLNDSSERYLPMAVEGRHLLLQKERILSIELAESEAEPPIDRFRETRVRIRVAAGSDLEGTLVAPHGARGNQRTLDYLNAFPDAFHCVKTDEVMRFVNGRHIVWVTELREDEPLVE